MASAIIKGTVKGWRRRRRIKRCVVERGVKTLEARATASRMSKSAKGGAWCVRWMNKTLRRRLLDGTRLASGVAGSGERQAVRFTNVRRHTINTGDERQYECRQTDGLRTALKAGGGCGGG